MARIKVRFNLRRGVNYQKWKIEYPNKETEFYNPCDVQLILKNCEVRNQKKTSEKIFNGGEKVVCAWVLCDEIEIKLNDFSQFDLTGDRLKYNPRVQPNWVLNNENVDNQKFNTIASVDYGLYVINN